MATVISCDRCGNVIFYTECKRIRIHKLLTETIHSNKCDESYDLCPDCYKALLTFIKRRVTNDNAGIT